MLSAKFLRRYLEADQEVHDAGKQEGEDQLHGYLRQHLRNVVGRDIVRSRCSLSQHNQSLRRDCEQPRVRHDIRTTHDTHTTHTHTRHDTRTTHTTTRHTRHTAYMS